MTRLRFGIAEVDITPPGGKGTLLGMLGGGVGAGVQWPLTGRVVVIDVGDNRAIFATADILLLADHIYRKCRTVVASAVDAKPEDVLVAVSHTHRGPATVGAVSEEETDWHYVAFLLERLTVCARAAVSNVQPARIRVGRSLAVGCTFNRRPMYRGDRVANGGPAYGDDFVRLEGPTDDELQVLAAESLDGRILGGLVSFASHPTLMGSTPKYSADYPGALTEELAKRFDAPFAFLLGACGDLGPDDLSQQVPGSRSETEATAAMGSALADAVEEAVDAAITVEKPVLQTARRLLEIPQRRVSREHAALARTFLLGEMSPEEFTDQVYGYSTFHQQITDWGGDGNYSARTVEEWFARELLRMWEIQRTLGSPELVEEVEIQAMSFGDVAFVAIPGELFTEYGLRIKAESPFRQTFVVTLANGWHGYIPTVEAFMHGGYETRLQYGSRLVHNAGEEITSAATEILKAVREPARTR
jgi:hypothetical protein